MAKIIVNETGKSNEVTTVHNMRYHTWYKRDDGKGKMCYFYRTYDETIQAWPDMNSGNICVIRRRDSFMDTQVKRFIGTISWSQE